MTRQLPANCSGKRMRRSGRERNMWPSFWCCCHEIVFRLEIWVVPPTRIQMIIRFVLQNKIVIFIMTIRIILHKKITPSKKIVAFLFFSQKKNRSQNKKETILHFTIICKILICFSYIISHCPINSTYETFNLDVLGWKTNIVSLLSCRRYKCTWGLFLSWIFSFYQLLVII